MYVGAWQEYKLMKVIEDLRDENERLRQTVGACEPPISPAPSTPGGPFVDFESAGIGFASSVPVRSPPLAGASPRRPSTEGTTHQGCARVWPDEAFSQYPPGHPLASSYRAAYQQALPSPALTPDDEVNVQRRYRGSGPAKRSGSASSGRLPFRIYWKPDTYGHYSIDNHEAARAAQRESPQNRQDPPQTLLAASASQHVQNGSGRHCATCVRKREAAEEAALRALKPASDASDGTGTPAHLTARSGTDAVIASWRQRDPSSWATVTPSGTVSTGQSACTGTASTTVTRRMTPPRYSPREAAILASMGLSQSTGTRADGGRASPSTISQRRVGGGGAPPPLLQHPLVHDLARRLPLDTKSLGQLAGQKVYERCVKSGEEVHVHRATAAGSTPPAAWHSGTTAGKRDDAFSDRQVERRLRLQALYSGMTPEAVEAYVRDQKVQSSRLPRARTAEGCDVNDDDNELGSMGAGEETASAHLDNADNVHRGVPWDTLPGPAPAVHFDGQMASAHPRTVVANLDDVLGVGGEDTVLPSTLDGNVEATLFARPPERQDIDETDVGGLVQWAENLDLDLIDDM